MKPKVTTRLVRNPYLSEQEEKLAKFCEENGIKFAKHRDINGRGKSHYELDFKPEFLDETEAHVSQHLDRTGIKYKFAVDKGGTHHYEFADMINLEPLDGRGEVIIDRKYVEHCMAEMPNLRRNYTKEIKLLEDDGHIKYIKDEIEKIKLQIEELKKSRGLKTRWEKIKFKWWSPYRNKVTTQVLKEVKKLEDKIANKESDIISIEAERMAFREMLILADIIPDEPKEEEKKEEVPSYKRNAPPLSSMFIDWQD